MTRSYPGGSVVVFLSAAERLAARRLAAARNNKPINADRRFSSSSGLEVHLMGTLGEFAFANISGFPVDRRVKGGGDNGIDFTDGDKRTYQIKSRSKMGPADPDLLCRIGYVKAEYFVLAYVNLNRPDIVGLIGWCGAEQLEKAERRDFGYGLRLVVPVADLSPMGFLI